VKQITDIQPFSCRGKRDGMQAGSAAMPYLSDYEHDIFVSYAHSDSLNDWSKRLIDETRNLVAVGLGLRKVEQVGLWWDYRLCGHQPLTPAAAG
jgi:hypothetical protein